MDTEIIVSNDLKQTLESLATEYNTSINNVIKTLMKENEELKNLTGYLATTKVSVKANKGNTFSFSTAIPKPIQNKFNLVKGQVLYWDIEETKIIITPGIQTNPEANKILKEVKEENSKKD